MVADGCVLCWGGGEHGQLGRGEECKVFPTTEGAKSVVHAVVADEPHEISCGASHSICAGRDGVYVWGNGAEGQLGTGDTNCRFVPQKLRLPFGEECIRGIACGAQHSIIWTHDGLCYGFGSNSFSQLPISTQSTAITTQTIPTLLSTVQHKVVVQVACGNRHTIFLYECGSVCTVGDNSYGQLGVGSRMASHSPQVLSELNDVRLIASGANHCLAVTETGELYCWGYGKAIGYKHKDIVRPTKKLAHYTNIVQLVGGSTHSLALTENGNVYSWGSGTDGQLGLGEEQLFQCKPVGLSEYLQGCKVCHIAASETLSAALTVDGSLYLWGYSHRILSHGTGGAVYKPLLIDLTPTKLSYVACGAWHIVALTGPFLTDASSAIKREMDNLPWEEERRLDQSPTETDIAFGTRCNSAQPLGGRLAEVRERTTLAAFYAATPEPGSSGLTVDAASTTVKSKTTLPDSILLPGFKLPAILDASKRTCAESAASQRYARNAFASAKGPASLRKSAKHLPKTVSPEAELSSEEDEEVENLLPMVTITRNQSRVTLVNTSNQSHVASVECNKQSHIYPREPDDPPPPKHPPLVMMKDSDDCSSDNHVIQLKLADANALGDEERNTIALNSGVWNPHRNSMFNNNVFYKDNKDSSTGVNTKLIGFLDMSDVQLMEKPSAKVATKSDKPVDRHSRLYSKEMNMRNLRTHNAKQAADNSLSPPPFSFQKANRRAQIAKQKPKMASMMAPLDRPQIHLQKPSSIFDLVQDPKRLVPVPSKYNNNLRNQYHSAPALLASPSLLRKPVARPVHPSPPDFSKAITKFMSK